MIEAADILARVCFLTDADAATIESFASIGVARTYPRGNVLYHAGDPCHVLFVVLSGRVKLCIIGEDGREVTLDMQNPGDVCGLVASVDGGPHVGTTITLSSSRLLAVPTDRLRVWIAQHPACQRALTLELARRLRATYGRIGSQVLLPVKERLRSVIHEIARSEGTALSDGELLLPRRTHQELAERVGSTRVVVTRALKELLEEDDINMENHVLRVRLTAVEE
jgi:CRP-like cAMP-binding protein